MFMTGLKNAGHECDVIGTLFASKHVPISRTRNVDQVFLNPTNI